MGFENVSNEIRRKLQKLSEERKKTRLRINALIEKSRRWTERGIELSSKEMTAGRAHQSFARAPKKRKKKTERRKKPAPEKEYSVKETVRRVGGKKSKESTKREASASEKHS